jgi:hypothetical protein
LISTAQIPRPLAAIKVCNRALASKIKLNGSLIKNVFTPLALGSGKGFNAREEGNENKNPKKKTAATVENGGERN